MIHSWSTCRLTRMRDCPCTRDHSRQYRTISLIYLAIKTSGMCAGVDADVNRPRAIFVKVAVKTSAVATSAATTDVAIVSEIDRLNETYRPKRADDRLSAFVRARARAEAVNIQEIRDGTVDEFIVTRRLNPISQRYHPGCVHPRNGNERAACSPIPSFHSPSDIEET